MFMLVTMLIIIILIINKYFIVKCLIQQFVCLCSHLRLWISCNFHSALLYSLTKTVALLYSDEFFNCYLQNTKSFHWVWGKFELWITRILSKLGKDAIAVKHVKSFKTIERRKAISIRCARYIFSGTVS